MSHVADDDQARSIINRLTNGLSAGSYLVLSDGAAASTAGVKSMELCKNSGAVACHLRIPERIARFFDGLDLIEPGAVPRDQWRPDPASGDPTSQSEAYCGVARKA